ncbi:MAG: M36 family metallopeptidase [Pyrinomonadaceae bacterium]
MTTAILLLAGLVVMAIPPQFRSRAANPASAAGSNGIRYETRLPHYDIRQDKEGSVLSDFYRQQQERTNLSGLQAGFKSAEARLSSRVPNLVLDRTNAFNTPEIVGTTGAKFLTAPSSASREAIARGFVSANRSLYGLTDAQVSQLKTFADYTNPAGNMSFVGLKQEINGIPVFQGELSASFTSRNELVRTINALAPGLNYDALPRTPAISAADAVVSAAKNIGMEVKASDIAPESVAADGRTVMLARGPFDEATKVELIYFPVGQGAAALAWSSVLWQPDVAYWLITDALTGKVLWRKCITNEQTQSATFGVYTGDNPAPSTPSGSTMPSDGFQGTAVPRTTITLIGNEAPNTFNQLGWITDGGNVTTGNNVDAGLDIDGVNGIDAAGRATGSPTRVFDFAYNPAPGIPAPGDAPTGAAYRNGAVTNIFYGSNRYHDSLYLLGFTEAARNFQTNNFGLGGLGNDFVRAEAQDSIGTNNANFNTPADGSLPRMQMFIFTGPTPDRDGDLDAEIYIHELTHGTSNRLHANAAGLLTAQSGGMGEGWGDFYARSLLSSADENLAGLYASGAYATNQIGSLGTANYYYGIRRFPYALKTTLGANGKPHYPLTYADIDPAQVNTSDGAFAESPLNFTVNNGAAEVHNIGEIWCMMLLEVRARIINRLGFAVGNQRMLQITTDAMKIEGASPTMIQARDALIAADQAGFGGVDVDDIWSGFATRGMGFGATTTGTATVTESFLTPNLILVKTGTGSLAFSDAVTGNNSGFADPGETIALTVPLNNPLGSAATGVTATIAGNTANYGTINGGATVSQVINYTVPAATVCGAVLTIPVDIDSNELALTTQTFILPTGALVIGFSQNFDGVTAPALPVGWTSAATGSEVPWVSVTTSPVDTAPNAVFVPDPTTVGNTELITPAIPITTASARLSFRNLYNMENSSVTAGLGFDGSVLEISIGGGAYQDILAAGGSFVAGGYNMTISTGFSSPIGGRMAWSGLSGGTAAAPTYITTTVNLPPAANGQNINLKFRAATDSSVAATGQAGVRVDSISISTGSSCTPVNPGGVYHPAYDFDGDNKGDLSNFRGSDGFWDAVASAGGANVQRFWGLTSLGDVIVPADYDGDGKADFAVFRNGIWYVSTNAGPSITFSWGSSGDIPAPGDFDNDGKADPAVYRPTQGAQQGLWYVLKSSSNYTAFDVVQWGLSGDKPVVGDYNGDGKDDYAVIRRAGGAMFWHIAFNGGGTASASWGLDTGDIAVPGDYDDDGKNDLAVFRPSDGNWYIVKSTGGSIGPHWGAAGDIPVPADYDGDGQTDLGVYRPSDTTWYTLRSTAGVSINPHGGPGTAPVPSCYNR